MEKFTDNDKENLRESLRGTMNEIKKLDSDQDDIFTAMQFIHIPNADIIIDALNLFHNIHNRDDLKIKLGKSLKQGFFLYNQTNEYLKEILRRSCRYYNDNRLCSNKMCNLNGEKCPGINRCSAFNDNIRIEYDRLREQLFGGEND